MLYQIKPLRPSARGYLAAVSPESRFQVMPAHLLWQAAMVLGMWLQVVKGVHSGVREVALKMLLRVGV